MKCKVRLRKYRSYRGDQGKIASNVLNREFRAERPNQKWATNVTEFSLFRKKLYLSPVIDLYNREIVSYDISEHVDFRQTINMMNDAFKRISDDSNLIFHSDQGWQYQMKRFQFRLSPKFRLRYF